jgi:hypothetical protein
VKEGMEKLSVVTDVPVVVILVMGFHRYMCISKLIKLYSFLGILGDWFQDPKICA